ncbi:MAG: hypothetical protein DMG17_24080 [Acidobacteria bacterium]|nr:MAG: hypothetical protein DMG17_24080 [Acidobacteriota bacterium]
MHPIRNPGARKEIKRQDCSKAVGHLENGLRLASDSSALNDLGNCYRLLGDFERAEASFKRAMELSDSVYIALNLAETYTAQAVQGSRIRSCAHHPAKAR